MTVLYLSYKQTHTNLKLIQYLLYYCLNIDPLNFFYKLYNIKSANINYYSFLIIIFPMAFEHKVIKLENYVIKCMIFIYFKMSFDCTIYNKKMLLP